MSTEKESFERLVTMQVISPDSYYSPDRAKDGWYSATLKARLKAIEEDPTKAETQVPLRKASTTKELVGELDAFAYMLLKPDSEIPQQDRLIHLRAKAQELGLSLRDSDLQRKLWEARRRKAGAVLVLKPGMTISAPDAVWAWQDLLMARDTQLVLAKPKVGKTTLVIAAIAAWHCGAASYLGKAFIGACPPVVIAGTDMPRSRWMPLLARFGLAEKVGEGEWRLPDNGPVKALFTQTEAVYLDHSGIPRIAEEVSKWKGCLLLVDSYAKCVGPLGLKESDSLFAAPLGDLQEAVAPFEVTTVVIHHSGHGRSGEGAVAASRGTTALPAAVSQIIALSWFNREKQPADNRVLLQTEGRGGEPQRMLIEQHDSGWTFLGDAEKVLHQQAMEAAKERLCDRQHEVLELCRERSQDSLRTDASAVTASIELPIRQARRTLQQLEHRGFLQSSKETTNSGQVVWYWIKASFIDQCP